MNGRLKCPDGKFEAQGPDFQARGQIELPKFTIMADIPAQMANILASMADFPARMADIPALKADIPALMADLDARRWADLLFQIP